MDAYLLRANIVADLAMHGTCLNSESCSHKLCALVLRARAALGVQPEPEPLREELDARRACLVAARDDLASIAKAKTEDGGLWIRAVAEARIPYLDEAIENTDAALSAGSGGREPRPEGREGMVTVYDHKGGYLGCMGRETWENAVAEEACPECGCPGDRYDGHVCEESAGAGGRETT